MSQYTKRSSSIDHYARFLGDMKQSARASYFSRSKKSADKHGQRQHMRKRNLKTDLAAEELAVCKRNRKNRKRLEAQEAGGWKW